LGQISENAEIRIQKSLPKSTAIAMDDFVLYLNVHFFRYVEGSKHITGGCDYRFAGPRWHWAPWLVERIFAKQDLVLKFDSPLCWDNESAPIPEEVLQRILSRIERALAKKRKGFKIEIMEPQLNSPEA
jgi:type I site-specific restriction endonuclease